MTDVTLPAPAAREGDLVNQVALLEKQGSRGARAGAGDARPSARLLRESVRRGTPCHACGREIGRLEERHVIDGRAHHTVCV